MEEAGEYNVKRKNSVIKRQIMYDSTYMWSLGYSNSQKKKTEQWFPAAEGTQKCHLMGGVLSLQVEESSGD